MTKSNVGVEFDAYLFSQINNSFFGNILLEVNGKSRKIGNFNLNAGVDFDLVKKFLTKVGVGIKLDRVQQLPENISGKKSNSSGKKVRRDRKSTRLNSSH